MGKSNIRLILEDLKVSFKHLRLLYRLCLLGAVFVWGLSGFYIVQSNEQGVVTRFGRVVREAVAPGMHYRLPWPIEKASKPRVKDIKRVHIGYIKETKRLDSAMVERLTGDTNIINVGLLLQYSIRDATDYLFMTENPDVLIRVVAEAALTKVVGEMSVDEILTVGKLKIQDKTQEIVQDILDKYGCGIHILNANLQEISPPEDVVESFKDIVNSQADMDKFITTAHEYKNMIIPEARGKAEALIRSAEGYKENVINRALGDTSRFLEILEEYQRAPQVSRDRLYIETMEKIGPKIRKCIIPSQLDGHLVKIYGTGLIETGTVRAEELTSALQSSGLEERQRAEEKPQESKEFEFSALTYSPNPIMVINPDTSIQYVNKALEKLTGFFSSELIGKRSPYPWWTEDTLKTTRFESVDKAIEHFKTKDGEAFWVKRTSKPVKKNGRLEYYLAEWVEIAAPKDRRLKGLQTMTTIK